MTEPEKVTARDVLLATVLGLLGGVAIVIVLLIVNGCTPAQRETVLEHSGTAYKFAACAQSVLAEEEQRRLREAREAEVAAELEAERLREVAREHSPTTEEEINKVMR